MSRGKAEEVALWAGLSAFFGNIIGLKVLTLLSGGDPIRFGVALLTSVIVAGAVYSRERLQAARDRRNGNGV